MIRYEFDATVSPADIADLRQAVGWNRMERDLSDPRLTTTLQLCAYDENHLIGYAQVVSNHVTDAYIQDVMVHPDYQRKGIGSRLMDAAEQIAAQHADTVCLGVGLCREYGSAQRMYAKRGYIPDGSGVWYQDKPCVQYETVCTVDDDLVLYLLKRLRG